MNTENQGYNESIAVYAYVHINCSWNVIGENTVFKKNSTKFRKETTLYLIYQ